MNKTRGPTVGQRVKINPDSQFYGKYDNNPIDVEGTVKEVKEVKESGLPYRVDWDDGSNNTYYESDLIIVGEMSYEIY